MDTIHGAAQTGGTADEPGFDPRFKPGFKGWLRRRLAKLGGQHGNAMVEIALVLPILMLVVTGIVNVGLMVFNYLSLENAVQMAAEQVAISRALTTDPCKVASNVVVAAQQGLNTSLLAYSLTINGTAANAIVFVGNFSCTSAYAAFNGSQYQSMALSVSYPYSLKVYGATLISGGNMTVRVGENIQ